MLPPIPNRLKCMTVYSGLRNYSHSCHFSSFVALQPGNKIDFWRGLYQLMYTKCLPLWRCIIFFIVKQTRNKTKKENLSFLFTPPPKSPFAAITAASLLGYVSIILAHLATGIFAHSSPAPSSWMGSAGVQQSSIPQFSIGLRSELLLGHSNTFKCFP